MTSPFNSQPSSDPEVVIRVENLYKEYRLGTISHGTLYRDLQSWWARLRGKEDPNSIIVSPQSFTPHASRFTSSENPHMLALNDVSFEVKRSEVLGIIGRNGAGKSTLLKILSEVTSPTKGQVKIKGRVASLLEVGTGFHPELTGCENIYLNGAILGMTKKEIADKFDEIVAFAEVEKFIDTPVKRYSSGMYVRLAFSVAAHLEPEILIVDEVLAVGDASFQKKCLGKMGDVAKGGRTVIFVSHNINAVRTLCQRCLWIEKGNLVADGSASIVTDSYIQTNFGTDTLTAEKGFDACTEKDFQVLSVGLMNEEGETTQSFDCDGSVYIDFSCVSRKSIPGLYGYMTLNMDNVCVLTSDTYDFAPNCLDSLPAGIYSVRIKIPPRIIGHGRYSVYLNFTSSQSNQGWIVDSPEYVCSFDIGDYRTQRGNDRGGYFSALLKWEVTKCE